MLDGTLSDESDDEKSKPNPEKYPSYEEWLKLRYQGDLKIFQKRFEACT